MGLGVEYLCLNFLDYLNKIPHAGGAPTTVCVLTVRRGWKHKIMVSVGLAPPEAFLADLSIGLLSASSHGPLSVLACVPVFSSYEDVSQMDQGPA